MAGNLSAVDTRGLPISRSLLDEKIEKLIIGSMPKRVKPPPSVSSSFVE
jgi:hypothetical protein